MKTFTGCDIVKISRMESFIKSGALSRCFTEEEEAYISGKKNTFETAAGLFAAKEALGKALGRGLSSFPLKSVWVCHDEFGAPFFAFGKDFPKKIEASLSISHDVDYAIATVFVTEE